MLFCIHRHKRVLLEITGEVMTSRVQSVVKIAAFSQKERAKTVLKILCKTMLKCVCPCMSKC